MMKRCLVILTAFYNLFSRLEVRNGKLIDCSMSAQCPLENSTMLTLVNSDVGILRVFKIILKQAKLPPRK